MGSVGLCPDCGVGGRHTPHSLGARVCRLPAICWSLCRCLCQLYSRPTSLSICFPTFYLLMVCLSLTERTHRKHCSVCVAVSRRLDQSFAYNINAKLKVIFNSSFKLIAKTCWELMVAWIASLDCQWWPRSEVGIKSLPHLTIDVRHEHWVRMRSTLWAKHRCNQLSNITI